MQCIRGKHTFILSSNVAATHTSNSVHFGPQIRTAFPWFQFSYQDTKASLQRIRVGYYSHWE